jgi:hypothetical protein
MYEFGLGSQWIAMLPSDALSLSPDAVFRTVAYMKYLKWL